jgi:hypothetical protein
MDNNFILYLIGFFVVIYIARLMGEKAMKHLDSEQKAGLIDLFTKERRYGSFIVLSLVVVFLIVLQYKLVEPILAFIGYFIIMVGYMLIKTYRTYNKLVVNNYPKEYINKIVAATILATVGILVFFALIFYQCFMD